MIQLQFYDSFFRSGFSSLLIRISRTCSYCQALYLFIFWQSSKIYEMQIQCMVTIEVSLVQPKLSLQFRSSIMLMLNHMTQCCEAKKSGWGYVVYRRGSAVAQNAGTSCTMTSSIWMKTEVMTKALSWLV